MDNIAYAQRLPRPQRQGAGRWILRPHRQPPLPFIQVRKRSHRTSRLVQPRAPAPSPQRNPGLLKVVARTENHGPFLRLRLCAQGGELTLAEQERRESRPRHSGRSSRFTVIGGRDREASRHGPLWIMEVSKLHGRPRMPCPFPHHLPRPLPCCQRPRLRSHAGPRGGEVAALPAEFARLPDPRAGRGRRFPLPSLLALSVCAPTPAGHDSLTAAADWCRRATVRVLALCGPT
ncbi:transposase family protein [Streptomyces sp. Y2F8-2]|uniref:transposase family protein n=1 Tax=Streptomyces sp. Y2F8-2 TaxID=2759675 RepID=UPI0035B51177